VAANLERFAVSARRTWQVYVEENQYGRSPADPVSALVFPVTAAPSHLLQEATNLAE